MAKYKLLLTSQTRQLKRNITKLDALITSNLDDPRTLPGEDLIREELCRRSFRDFILTVNPAYTPNWHHEIIIKELQHLVDDPNCNKLILTMPPRHGKSELASRLLPAWLFLHNRNKHIIAASYSGDLAENMCRDVKRIMSSDEFFQVCPELYIGSMEGKKADTGTGRAMGRRAFPRNFVNRSDYFELPRGKGTYRCSGVGGSITGMGGDYLILDDPVKNGEEANSPALSDKSWDWFGNTFLTRQAPGAKILVIQTRWSMKDITGRILESSDAPNWRVVSFPAIQFENQYRHPDDKREVGEVLWPDRFPLSELNKIKPLLSRRDWNCLYQCNPVPAEGNIINPKDFVLTDTLPNNYSKVIQSWDLAFGDSNDYVAGIVIGLSDNKYYLLDLFHKKVSFNRTISAIKSMSEVWPTTSKIYIEKSANGFAAIDVLQKEFSNIVPVVAKGDKASRVSTIVHLIENGRVLAPANAPWLNEFLLECGQFPNGAHDDMVDAMSQGLNQIYTGKKSLASFIQAYSS